MYNIGIITFSSTKNFTMHEYKQLQLLLLYRLIWQTKKTTKLRDKQRYEHVEIDTIGK